MKTSAFRYDVKDKPEAGLRLCGVTICALNYFHKAKLTRESFLRFHAEASFFIVLLGEKDPVITESYRDYDIIWACDLGIKDFLSLAFQYDIIEMSTNIKPFVLKTLLGIFETVLYLDPDIMLYDHLGPIFNALETHSIVVTPHSTTPILDGNSPSDIDFLRFGIFNLGFIGVKRGEEALKFLDWWSDRCIRYGFYEPQSGLAVDQIWINLAVSYFSGIWIEKNCGLNVAFWNLHERMLSKHTDGKWYVNGKNPLLFFHFSSFDISNPHSVAKKQSRFMAGSREDLHELLDEYASLLKANGLEFGDVPYSFNYFKDGMRITSTLRRFYYTYKESIGFEEDPFMVGSYAYKFAKKYGLFSKDSGKDRLNFKDLNQYSTSAVMIERILRLVLQIFGPDRYFDLMRYLVHISSIRNQNSVLK